MDTPTTTTWASLVLVLRIAVFISVENPVFLIAFNYKAEKMLSSIHFIIIFFI